MSVTLNNNIIVEVKESYKELTPKEGFKIIYDECVVDKLIVPMEFDVSRLIIVEDGTYVPPSPPLPQEPTVSEVQENQIKLSKLYLATYLEENPLFSTVKYEDGRYYNVTLQKQYSLTDRLLKHTIFKGTKPLYWNSVGETSEIWTYEELLKLSTEIEDYVNPLVELQREVELRIRECTTQEEVLAVDINPYREEALRLNAINTLNNK